MSDIKLKNDGAKAVIKSDLSAIMIKKSDNHPDHQHSIIYLLKDILEFYEMVKYKEIKFDE